MNPQQEVFNLCREIAVSVFGTVYDSRPLQSVSYPFCEISEQQTVERLTKSTVLPTIYQTFHIFADNKKQGTARRMANEIKSKLRKAKHTKRYYIGINGIRERTLQDNSTSTPLFHIVMEVEFILY